MPVKQIWLHENIVLQQQFDGHVTGQELDHTIHQTMELLQDSEDVYLLFDFSESARLPEKLFELASITQLLSHASVRWLAIINPENADKHTTQLLARGKVKVFDSMTMAYGFLKGMYRMDTGDVLE